ncbi:MAG TPA: hypothetical protein DCY79_06860, partial [Planctomycetaceae bacterium]|nr:hypothetical protein [Planctomycetaceae bacterium]
MMPNAAIAEFLRVDNLARKRTFPDAATLQVFAPPQGDYQLNPQLARKLLKVMLTSRQADSREYSLMRQGKGWFHIPA